jgi:hypothetical protein
MQDMNAIAEIGTDAAARGVASDAQHHHAPVSARLQILTHSCMSTFKTCQRKFEYSYVKGIRKDVDSKPLRLGGAVHKGLELIATQSLEAACEAIIAEYSVVPAWANTDELVNDWLTEGAVALQLVRGYARQYQSDGFKVVAAEVPFELPIINPETGRPSNTYRFAGKIDRIIETPAGLMILETKTTGESIDPESDYWLRLRIDTQISGYILAARKLGYDVQSVMYDVIRKPSIRVTKKETIEQYAERLYNDLAERPGFYFARREIPRLESDLDEFRRELWRISKDVRDSELANFFYRNTSACLAPYKCTYWSLCTNGFTPSSTLPDGFTTVSDVHPELAKETL